MYYEKLDVIRKLMEDKEEFLSNYATLSSHAERKVKEPLSPIRKEFQRKRYYNNFEFYLLMIV